MLEGNARRAMWHVLSAPFERNTSLSNVQSQVRVAQSLQAGDGVCVESGWLEEY